MHRVPSLCGLSLIPQWHAGTKKIRGRRAEGTLFSTGGWGVLAKWLDLDLSDQDLISAQADSGSDPQRPGGTSDLPNISCRGTEAHLLINYLPRTS